MDAFVRFEVIDIERHDVFYAVNNHGRDDPRIVRFGADDRMKRDEPLPFSVHVFSFEEDRKEELEARDVALDS